MKEFIASNTGKTVRINVAPFGLGIELKNELLKLVKEQTLAGTIKVDNTELLDREVDIAKVLDVIKHAFISIEISKSVQDILEKCLSYCTYDGVHKINTALFDTICPDAREDYYEILIACIEENMRPFVKSLASAWKINAPKLGNFQNLLAIAK